jgi:dethiobiotin synthetase
VTIQLQPIVTWVAESEADWTLVETAGALLSPLSMAATNLDLTVALEPEAVVLVAPDRLGVLHDLTVTLFAYRQLGLGLPAPFVALQPPADADSSTGQNAAELIELGLAPLVFSFPRGPADGSQTLAVATELARHLGMLPS